MTTAIPFRDLFVATWGRIHAALEGAPSIGVVAVAVNRRTGRVIGSLHVPAEVAMPAVSIIGAHPACDLQLPDEPTTSLRHVALVVEPLTVTLRIAFRVMDLRSTAAFADEEGRRLESICSEGPAFLAVGGHAMFILPVDDERNWPEDAEDAWACVPERIYLADHEARRHRRPKADPSPGRTSVIWTRGGPSRRTLMADELPLGELIVSGRDQNERERVAMGGQAADTGILIGRFERCDTYGLRVIRDPGISRVHVLVVTIDGQLYAIDTSSTNGSYTTAADGAARRVRVTRLNPMMELVLGNGLARVSWCPR